VVNHFPTDQFVIASEISKRREEGDATVCNPSFVITDLLLERNLILGKQHILKQNQYRKDLQTDEVKCPDLCRYCLLHYRDFEIGYNLE
jgi:hypothetical protein